jgi:hypothetical protein
VVATGAAGFGNEPLEAIAVADEIQINPRSARATQIPNQAPAQVVVFGTETEQRDLVVFLQQASGGFLAASPLRVATQLTGEVTLVTDDFNADWRADVAIVGSDANQIHVQSISIRDGIDNQAARIISTNSSLPLSPSLLAAQPVFSGDFNNDGNLDLALGNTSIQFLKGIGDGAFGPPETDDDFRIPDPAPRDVVRIADQRIVEDGASDPIPIDGIPITTELVASSNVKSFANIDLVKTDTTYTVTVTPRQFTSGVATITLSPTDDSSTPEDESTIALAQFRVIVRAEANLPTLVVPDRITARASDPITFEVQAALADASDGSEELSIDASAGIQLKSNDDGTFTVVNPRVSRDFALNVTATAREKSTGETTIAQKTITVDAGDTAVNATNVFFNTQVDLQGTLDPGDKDVYRLDNLQPESIVTITPADGAGMPNLRFFIRDDNDAERSLHDGESFLATTFRIPKNGEYFAGDYFLEVAAPGSSSRVEYHVIVKRPEGQTPNVVIVPVGSAGVSIAANAQDSYQLKLDQSQIFRVSGATLSGVPNTAGTSFETAFDKDGTYVLQPAFPGENINITHISNVAEQAALATYLTIDSPVTLPVNRANGIDWYRVELEQGSNVSIGGQRGLSFFISQNGTPADAERIFATPSGSNFLISGRKDTDATLFIRADTRLVSTDVLVVQRADAFGVGQAPAAAVTGDIDNDGLLDVDFNDDSVLDVAVVNKASDSVSILLGIGDGTFRSQIVASLRLFDDKNNARPVHDIAALLRPASLVVADFNNDRVLDLATANSLSNDVTILLGNKDEVGNWNGTFRSAGERIPVGKDPVAMQAGDFDTDGDVDLAVANQASHNVTILLANASGGFAPADSGPVPVGQNPKALVMGYFNADTIFDLATANKNSISILLGDGKGRFPLESPHDIDAPHALLVSDKGMPGLNHFLVLTGDSAHWVEHKLNHFEPSPAMMLGQPEFVPIALADMDGDGTNDLIMFKPGDPNGTSLSQLQIMKGMADGTFVRLGEPSEVRFSESTLASPVVFAFINNDDRLKDEFGRLTDQPANFRDVIFIDSANGEIRPLTGDGEGGLRTFGTPAESTVPTPTVTTPTELEFPELLFAESLPAQQIEASPPPLAGAQTISGSGGSAGGTGAIPTEDVEVAFEPNESFPETALEAVGSVAVDVLEIDESAFIEPAPPWNVADLVEPIRLVATNTTTETVPAEEAPLPVLEPPDRVGEPVATVAAEPTENNARRVGWIAGAAAVVIAPLVYWITKTRLARLRKRPK